MLATAEASSRARRVSRSAARIRADMACATRMRANASAVASAIRFSAGGDFGMGM